VPQGVAMPTGELDELLAGIAALPWRPTLIIIDTLARSFGPGDENSTTDMGAFVKACDRLRAETGACVLVVHHTGKDVEKGARGSTALTGAADCIIAVKRRGDSLTVMNRAPFGKQKDAEEFADIALSTSRVTFTHQDVEMHTLVLIPDTDLIAPTDNEGEPRSSPSPRLGGVERAILAHLTRCCGREQGLTSICASVEGIEASILRALGTLTEKGKIMQAGEPGALRWSIR